MTSTEAVKVLAILKAAYPNSYKGITAEEAKGTVMVWATQFVNIPADIVIIAINKLISTNTFPPSISEVKQRIKDLYWEVWEILNDNRRYNNLSDSQLKQYERIMEVVEPMRAREKTEPTLKELMTAYNSKQIEG